MSLTLKPTGLKTWSHCSGGRLTKLRCELWRWSSNSSDNMLHKSKYLLLHQELLLLHGLLPPLELILSSLNQC